ncbi:uncharacterized protein LOC128388218 [Panonychus citri]|uniref:uncharacterized protein LOC128388218 n=1 Tax=Panonychus citri TaxID=50023 RepID=UPI0023076FC0|nr:uncharacterized protein LOC128388218 [Panonychus citri]
MLCSDLFTIYLLISFWFVNCVQCLCGHPGRPAYGKLLTSSFTQSTYNYGDTVNYACEKGYYLRGRGSRTCLNNGKWSGGLPICDSPLQIYGESTSPESIKLYPPSLAIDNNPRTCFYSRRSKPREWTLDLMVKRKVTSVIITVPFASSEHFFTIFLSSSNNTNSNGILSSTINFNHNRTRCSTFQGMFATQTQLIVCSSDGVEGRYLTISDASSNYEYFGLCEVKVMTERDKYECGEAEKPLNSLPIETHKDNIVSYQCKNGYNLEGPSQRYCSKDGSWSDGQAICREVTCKQLETPLNSKMIINGLNSNNRATVLSQAYVQCDPGYSIVGQSRLVCMSTGQWSMEIPKCIAIDCGLPRNVSPESTRFILLNGTTKYGSMALMECSNDQGLPETETIICQDDGQWSVTYLSCYNGLNKNNDKGDSFVQSQLNLGNSGNGNLITTLVIIIVVTLTIAIVLLTVLLLKRKFFSVKLVTWREHNHSDGQTCKGITTGSQYHRHKRLRSTLRSVRRQLGFRSDLSLFGSLKGSIPSPPSSDTQTVDGSPHTKIVSATISLGKVQSSMGTQEQPLSVTNGQYVCYENDNATNDSGQLIVSEIQESLQSEMQTGIGVTTFEAINENYESYQNFQSFNEIVPPVVPSRPTVSLIDQKMLPNERYWFGDTSIRTSSSRYFTSENRSKRKNIALITSPSPPPCSSFLMSSSNGLDFLPCKKVTTDSDSFNNLVSQVVQVDIEVPLDVIESVNSPEQSTSSTIPTFTMKSDKINIDNGKVDKINTTDSIEPIEPIGLSKLSQSADEMFDRKLMTIDHSNKSYDDNQPQLDFIIDKTNSQQSNTRTDNHHHHDSNHHNHTNNLDNVNKNNKTDTHEQSNGHLNALSSNNNLNSANNSVNGQPSCETFVPTLSSPSTSFQQPSASSSVPVTINGLPLIQQQQYDNNSTSDNLDISIITQKSYHSFSSA